MQPIISLRNEEREELLDAFSMCNAYLREEAALAAQCFDDLGGYCPDRIAQCEPLGTINEEQENARFLMAFEELGIHSAKGLAEWAGASVEACEAVWANPIRCDAEKRATVIEAMEANAAADLWGTSHCTGGSVGDFLYLWLRRNFKTPYQFKRAAQECELKSYLVGAVGGLSDNDLKSLLHPICFATMLQDAAEAERQRWRRHRAALWCLRP